MPKLKRAQGAPPLTSSPYVHKAFMRFFGDHRRIPVINRAGFDDVLLGQAAIVAPRTDHLDMEGILDTQVIDILDTKIEVVSQGLTIHARSQGTIQGNPNHPSPCRLQLMTKPGYGIHLMQVVENPTP